MKNSLALPIYSCLKPLAIAVMAITATSCSTLTSYIPYVGKSSEEQTVAENEQAVLTETEAEDTEAIKYGFQRNDQSTEEAVLMQRFELDKDNLDHAITNTKDLISKSYGRPFLPELYIRLAELYAEKSRIVFFLRRLEMGERGKMREISSVEATGLKQKAVETYLQIISHFPEFEELDKVHFYLAHELRELGKYPEMSEQYEHIIKEFPKSEFVPESLLLLGDYAFEQKEIDKALGHYRNVLQYPRSSAIVIARYKLAWVHINKRQFKEALALFEISVNNQDASRPLDVDTYNRVDIRQEALADMAYSYSQVYEDTKPGEASEYFKKYAWSRQSYMMVMEKLANRYMIKHKWDNAAYIYRELATIQFDGKKLLEYTDNLFICLLESKNYEGSDNDVALIVKALEQGRYSVHMDEAEKAKQMRDYEIYARDITTRLHNTAKRTGEKADFEIAVNVYEQFLNFFDESPEYNKMKLNYAESLFAAGDFTRAGKVYEEIASTIDDPKSKHDPLYSAAVAYYTALNDREALNYYQIAYSQDGLRDVGQTYVSLYPNSNKVPDIKFNIARIKYDEGEFDQAVEEFAAFVKQYPQGTNAKAAVELMMDALHLTENYSGLVQLQEQMSQVAQLDPEVKQNLAKVGKAAQAKIVQSMIVDSINDWESGKEKLLDFAENTETAGMDIQALNALFVSSEEHGDIETMHVAGQSIVARFPSSEHAQNALKALIDLSLSTAQFRALADYLEQYALQFPKSHESSDFLFQAGQLRDNMQQYDLAIKDYDSMLRGRTLDRQTRHDVALALVNAYQDKRDMESAYKALEKYKNYLGGATASALGAKLARDTGRISTTERYLKSASRYLAQGELNTSYAESLGDVAYSLAMRNYDRYMNLQLKGTIDNSVVEAKTALQEQLQSDLIKAFNFKAPRWSVLAGYRLHEINNEYAKFLETAPVPDGFAADEIQQYKEIIAAKSLEYKNAAVQYLQAGQDLANRIRPFDTQISTYNPDTATANGHNRRFNQNSQQQQISLEALKDSTLRKIYDALFKNPEDYDLLLELARTYQQRGDLGQAMVISKNLLNDERKLGKRRRSEAYAMMGSIYMYFGKDNMARDALEKSLDVDSGNYSATVNLAGLYRHYGYDAYANGVYSKRSGLKSREDSILIHARAEGFFNAAN